MENFKKQKNCFKHFENFLTCTPLSQTIIVRVADVNKLDEIGMYLLKAGADIPEKK